MNNVSSKIQRRARKNQGITSILTFFVPFAGYIYTVRYLSAAIVFFLTIVLASDDFLDDDLAPLYGFLMLGAAVENVVSVQKARKSGQNKPIQPSKTTLKQLPNLQVEVLKMGKDQGEMTLSDFVIATEASPDKIQEILMELERWDLVRVYNRDSDGVVVYQVI